MPATVYGNQFVVNSLPLTEGTNTITVTATDTVGNTTTSTINVNAVTTGNYIRLSSNIESGIAPLEVSLRMDGSFSITASNLNVSGPTQPEVISSTVDEYQLKFITEGVYIITAITTGPDSIDYEDAITIIVMNKNQLDTLLKGKWEGMKEALANQDIISALNHYTERTQQHYNQVFTDLYNHLPQFVQDMKDIQLIYVKNNTAKYRIKKNELYAGQLYEVAYYIYFVIDNDGMWRIEIF